MDAWSATVAPGAAERALVRAVARHGFRGLLGLDASTHGWAWLYRVNALPFAALAATVLVAVVLAVARADTLQ